MKLTTTPVALLVLGACVVPGQQPPPGGSVPPAAPIGSNAPAVASGPSACIEESNPDSGDFDQAMLLEAGSIAGCLANGDKVDTFVLQVPDTATAIAYSVTVTSTEQVFIKSFDAQRGQALSLLVQPGEQKQLWLVAAGGSLAYLKLESATVSRSTSYALAVSASPVTEPDEPNNNFEAARPVLLNTPYQAATLNAMNDAELPIDYYRLEVPQAGELTVSLEQVTPRLQLKMELFDPSRARVDAKLATNPGQLLTATRKVKTSGTYFVSVRPIGTARTAYGGALPQPMPATYTINASLK